MATKGLWPTDLKSTPQASLPEQILEVQAHDLAEKTRGLLEGLVERGSHGEWLTIDFYVTVPSRDHFAYHLFKVRHKIPPFPLEIILPSTHGSEGPSRIPVRDRKHFERRLEAIFSTPAVRHVVEELLGYAQKKSTNGSKN